MTETINAIVASNPNPPLAGKEDAPEACGMLAFTK